MIEHMKCFTAKYNGYTLYGKISIEGGKVFLCQNHLNGAKCYDRLGYKYSYCIGNGDKPEEDSIYCLQVYY